MRALLVSDLHYDLRKLDWVLAQAADVDLLVVAGDLLDIASCVPLDAQIVVVLEYLARFADRTDHGRLLGQPRPRPPHGRRREGHRLAPRRPRAAGSCVDGDSVEVGGWLVTSCAWWEGPETLRRLEDGPGPRRRRRGGGRGSGCTTGRRKARWPGPGSKHYGDPELPRLLEEHQPGHRAVRSHPRGARSWTAGRGPSSGAAPGCSTAATSGDRSPPTSFLDLDAPHGGVVVVPGLGRAGAGRAGPRPPLSSRATDPNPARSRPVASRPAGRGPSRASCRWPSASAYCARTSPRYASRRWRRPASWRASSRPISGWEAKKASGSPMIRTVDALGGGHVGGPVRAEQRARSPRRTRPGTVTSDRWAPSRSTRRRARPRGPPPSLASPSPCVEQHLTGLEAPLRHAAR